MAMFWITFMIVIAIVSVVSISWFMKQIEKEEYN